MYDQRQRADPPLAITEVRRVVPTDETWFMKRALIVLAAVSAVAAAGLAVFGIEAATAALAVSWLCGLGWLVLSARATSTKLSQVLEHQRASSSWTNGDTDSPFRAGQAGAADGEPVERGPQGPRQSARLGAAHAERHSRARTGVRPAGRP